MLCYASTFSRTKRGDVKYGKIFSLETLQFMREHIDNGRETG